MDTNNSRSQRSGNFSSSASRFVMIEESQDNPQHVPAPLALDGNKNDTTKPKEGAITSSPSSSMLKKDEIVLY